METVLSYCQCGCLQPWGLQAMCEGQLQGKEDVKCHYDQDWFYLPCDMAMCCDMPATQEGLTGNYNSLYY